MHARLIEVIMVDKSVLNSTQDFLKLDETLWNDDKKRILSIIYDEENEKYKVTTIKDVWNFTNNLK